MRITIAHGTEQLLMVHADPGRSVMLCARRALTSAELRRALALAIVTLAEERQARTGQPLDVATVDVSMWLTALARQPRRRRRRA